MEPRIQYAQTKDGVSIAFYTMGEGPPHVAMPILPLSHLEKMWQLPLLRHHHARPPVRQDASWPGHVGSVCHVKRGARILSS